MKNTHSLVLSISAIKDIDKIKENTKYINLDITNCNYDVIEYFLKNGENYLYTEIIDNEKGYTYVGYEDFKRAENIISLIYAGMPNSLNKLQTARYLYTSIAKYVFFDIDIIPEKNESYSFSLINKINNIWGSLSSNRVTKSSITKIYYYLCKRIGLDIYIEQDTRKELYNKLIIDKEPLNLDLFSDIPYIQAKMITKYFAHYNDNLELDKKVKYINNKYNNVLIEKALKNTDYTKENCVEEILYKTQNIIEAYNLFSVELSIIYEYIFSIYCPNYNIKINNLYKKHNIDNQEIRHFIMITYNDKHYTYDNKIKSFIRVNDLDIVDNIHNGKMGLYKDELIPNIKINLNV